MRKKILSIMLAAILTLSLTACGGIKEETNAGETDTAKTEETEVVSQEDTNTEVAEEVTLSLMVTTRPTTDNKDFYLDWLPELIKE